MKKFFAAAIALSLAFSANAQIRIGAGIMTGMPIGSGSMEDGEYSFSDNNGFGIGGGISGEYMLTENIGVGLSIGFLSFSGKTESVDIGPFTVDVEYPALTMIPIQLQANYHFMPGETFNFYAGLGVGMNLLTISSDGADDASESGFGITPKVGATYMFSDALGIDLNIGYTLLNVDIKDYDSDNDVSTDFSYIPINLGVVYVIE